MMDGADQRLPLDPLSDRELEILRHIASELTNREIAQELFLSLNTIKWHNRQIYSKLGVSNRKQAVAAAKELGLLIDPSDAASVVKAAPSHNLPAQITSFIGREEQIAAVLDLLQEARLLTLSGPPGVGKTRLALQVAEHILNDYPDGVFFVDLAPIRDPGLVSSAIARILDVKVEGGADVEKLIRHFLADKNLLLVLDNFEHVIDAAYLVSDLLMAAPQLKILVTSRELLRLYGEHSYPVPVLDYPRNGKELDIVGVLAYDAVQLFSQRARAASPDFTITNHNAAAAVNVCAQLEGIPLALELAAERVRMFDVDTLYERLHERLQMLESVARNLPDRQQTLRCTIEWSYNLLTEEEQTLFTRLGVFVGGWSTRAAETICAGGGSGDVPTGLESLLDKNLIRRIGGPGGDPRFSMLETIREFAVEQLDDDPAEETLREAHLVYFRELAEESDEPMRGGQDMGYWMPLLEAEHANIRAALEWAVTTERYAEAARLAYSAWHFWWYRGHFIEANRWYKRLLTHCEHLPEAVLVNLIWAAGWAAGFAEDHARWSTLVRELVALQRKRGDRAGLAEALKRLGDYEGMHGNLNAAQQATEESLAMARALGDLALQANILNSLGEIARAAGNFQQAGEYYTEALSYSNISGSFRTAICTFNLCCTKIHQGEIRQAKELIEHCYTLVQQGDIAFLIPGIILGWAGILIAENMPERGAQLLGASRAQGQKIGLEPDMAYDLFVAQARDVLGDAAFKQLFEEGQAISIEEALISVSTFVDQSDPE